MNATINKISEEKVAQFINSILSDISFNAVNTIYDIVCYSGICPRRKECSEQDDETYECLIGDEEVSKLFTAYYFK